MRLFRVERRPPAPPRRCPSRRPRRLRCLCRLQQRGWDWNDDAAAGDRDVDDDQLRDGERQALAGTDRAAGTTDLARRRTSASRSLSCNEASYPKTLYAFRGKPIVWTNLTDRPLPRPVLPLPVEPGLGQHRTRRDVLVHRAQQHRRQLRHDIGRVRSGCRRHSSFDESLARASTDATARLARTRPTQTTLARAILAQRPIPLKIERVSCP